MDIPDDCPVHELARTDPGATVNVYNGRSWLPMSAEMACDGHHLSVLISKQWAKALSESGIAL